MYIYTYYENTSDNMFGHLDILSEVCQRVDSYVDKKSKAQLGEEAASSQDYSSCALCSENCKWQENSSRNR